MSFPVTCICQIHSLCLYYQYNLTLYTSHATGSAFPHASLKKYQLKCFKSLNSVHQQRQLNSATSTNLKPAATVILTKNLITQTIKIQNFQVMRGWYLLCVSDDGCKINWLHEWIRCLLTSRQGPYLRSWGWKPVADIGVTSMSSP